jgi:hypothetical protein
MLANDNETPIGIAGNVESMARLVRAIRGESKTWDSGLAQIERSEPIGLDDWTITGGSN